MITLSGAHQKQKESGVPYVFLIVNVIKYLCYMLIIIHNMLIKI